MADNYLIPGLKKGKLTVWLKVKGAPVDPFTAPKQILGKSEWLLHCSNINRKLQVPDIEMYRKRKG